jgi:hypothetical protein
MRRAFWLAGPLLLGLIGSCSLFLDTESLQKGGSGGSSATTGAGGTSGAAGEGGGTSTDGGDGGPRGIPIDGLAGALAQALCDNLNACYISAKEIVIHDEDCVDFFTKVLTGTAVAPAQESIARGQIGYNPIEAAICVSKLAQGTMKSPPECSDFNAVVEDCKRMLTKLAGEGQRCRNRFECAKGLFCDASASCPGTCKPFAQQGAVCTVNDDCDPVAGFYCEKAADAGADRADGGVKGTCQPFVAVNADCGQNKECVPGALCIDRKCRRGSDLFTLAETFTCYTNGLLCKSDLHCEFSGIPLLSMGTCVKEKQPLDPCKLSLPSECPANYYCSANILNTMGKCLVSPVENQKCATDAEQNAGLAAPCHSGLVCVNGICKPARQLDEPCETNAQCYSSTCRTPEDGGAATCAPAGCP